MSKPINSEVLEMFKQSIKMIRKAGLWPTEDRAWNIFTCVCGSRNPQIIEKHERPYFKPYFKQLAEEGLI
jgi:hypothetical protein